MDLQKYREKVTEAGVVFAPGLTESEVRAAEQSYRFIFPPDLREFLMFALPITPGWPDWRDLDHPVILRMLEWPYEGICFDIEHDVFWPETWGPKPASLADAFAIAKQKVEGAPKLIPVNGHRYLPDRPNTAGNPVLSVYQTDVIYYGSDLWNYFENEFHNAFKTEKGLGEPIRRIEFWSDIIENYY